MRLYSVEERRYSMRFIVLIYGWRIINSQTFSVPFSVYINTILINIFAGFKKMSVCVKVVAKLTN